MKKLLVLLMALCMILTFVPVSAANGYDVKGIAEGDRFAISILDVNPVQRVYVVNAGATGVAPTNATGLDSVDFYVDSTLVGSSNAAPFYYDIPLTSGNHELEVVANVTGGSGVTVGDYNYSVAITATTTDSKSFDFEEGTAGSAATPTSLNLGANETCTYATAPDTGSTAIKFAYTGEGLNGGSTTTSFDSGYVSLPATHRLMTLDYDFYMATKNGVRIHGQLRNGSGAVATGYNFGTLNSNTCEINTWHHYSVVFDFNSYTWRAYLDGYEFERGTLVTNNGEIEGANPRAYVRFWITRYNETAEVYVDNFKFSGKEDVAGITPTPYAVKGIKDGDRIPAGLHSLDLNRTISVVNASATLRSVTSATNLAKADFYIDGVLAGTVTSNPCQWTLPAATDFNPHVLTVVTTDIAGNTQNFGPYTYDPVNTVYGATSLVEEFEGTVGDSVTAAKLNRIPTFAVGSTDPRYVAAPGREGTAVKFSIESGKNITIQTTNSFADAVAVPASGFTTYSLDFYCSKASEYMKFYLYSRATDSTNIKSGTWEILSNYAMNEIDANKWHTLSYVFDSDALEYIIFIDGYEIERGAMNANIVNNKRVFLRLDTQSYTTCDFYVDNIVMESLESATDVTAAFTDNGNGTASIIAINDVHHDRDIDIWHTEYDSDGEIARYVIEPYTTLEGEIWRGTASTVTVATDAIKTRLFAWGYGDHNPLGAYLEVLKQQ